MDTGNDVQNEARTLKRAEDGQVRETPEDVAVLYSWANVHGAKYRDFSASRREYRAQMRRRMAEQQVRDAEQHAAEEARAAAEAQAVAEMAAQEFRVAAGAVAARQTEEARKAAQAAAEAEAAAEKASREEEVARAELLAQMQVQEAVQKPSRMKPPVPPATVTAVAGALDDPYRVPGHGVAQRVITPPAAPATPSLAERIAATAPVSSNIPPARPAAPQSPAKQSWTDPVPAPMPSPLQSQAQIPAQNFYAPAPAVAAYEPHIHEPQYSQPEQMRMAPPMKQTEYSIPPVRPAWLHESEQMVARSQQQPSPLADTLQHSRERVAARWFALKGVFEGAAADQELQPARQAPPRTPALAVFSLAGGVGKTSIVATLGRALSSLGERALLADTTAYGLLPFYFGARELRPGVVRTFAPPSGSTDAPINLMSLEAGETTPEMVPVAQDWLAEEIARGSRGANRVLVDLATASGALMRRIMRMGPVVLVPVSPDMNSVISISAVEQFFQNQVDADGRPVKVFYILNQFDASQPLHLDVREVLRQQLGDRLLPFVIRRSAAISEALAEGMTVMDYAPNSPVAEDYMNLAAWVRNVSAPASLGFRGVRWSEQR